MATFKDDHKTEDGRTWYFKTYKKDFNGDNKAYKSKRYLTKSEALEAERLFLMKRDNPINKPFILVASAYFEEMYKIRKESTVYCYVNVYNTNIKPYFEHFKINDINISEIRKWHETIDKMPLKLSYKNKIYTILNSIFKFAVKNYDLNRNVCAIVGCFQSNNEDITDDTKKIRYITYEEFSQFIKVIDNSLWKTFFIFLYYTGMRKGEVQALNWNDIDFTNNIIKVNKTLSTKTAIKYKITSTKNYKNREIKMSKFLCEQLSNYKEEVSKYSDFNNNWFIFGNTRFLPHITIDRYKHYYFQLSQTHEITIHEFRHSHVSLLINEYIKISQEKNMKVDTAKFFLMMSNRMGHTIQVMQKTYMHLFPTIQDEIIDILDNL